MDLLLAASFTPAAVAAAGPEYTARLTTAAGSLLEDTTVATAGDYSASVSLLSPAGWIIQIVAFRDTGTPVTATVTAAPKSYDGTTSATITGCTLTGVTSGDVVTCSAAGGSFASATVGAGKVVTATGITLGGAAAAYYTLAIPTATTTAAITPVLVTATVTAANKAYDGTTAATANCTVSGVLGADGVTCAGSATFNTALVGTGKTVTVGGIALDGTAAGNYALASTTATTTADITAVTVTATVTAANKVYDGTTAASAACALTGIVGTDVVTCAGTATFDTALVGTGKTVTMAGIALSGAHAANYLLASTTATTTADITAAAPTITMQPVSQTITAQQVVTFTAAASGSPAPAVQWQVSTNGGSTFTNIAGATQTSYSFITGSADHGKLFRAVFTNSEGSATTNAATLFVTEPLAAPIVTAHPASITVAVGGVATFAANASGSPAPSARWQSSPNGTTWTDIPGATAYAYSFTTQASDSGRQFRVVFSNGSGVAMTNVATLTVAPDDTPLLGDMDGDGKSDLVVWRRSDGTWNWLTSSSSYAAGGTKQWGNFSLGDVPMLAAMDGDGRSARVMRRACTA